MFELAKLPVLRGSHIHFVGIGGIGMMALAQYVHHAGAIVSGSDSQDGPQLQILRELGINVKVGHDPANVEGAELIVNTAAASLHNVEVREATERGIPVVKRARLLGLLTRKGSALAVAGTHGKTTTTAIAGHILRKTGVDVTVMGGGFIRGEDESICGPAILGANDQFVVEADEYDRSFLELSPTVAIVTSLDFDHPDCYASFRDLEATFETFMNKLNGSLVVRDSPHIVSLAKKSGLPYETYGFESGCDWEARNCQRHQGTSSFTLVHEGEMVGICQTSLMGDHNTLNIVGAIAASSTYAHLDPELLLPQVRSFRGVARRLEPKGTVGGVAVVDDYAHHPAEIKATIDALESAGSRVRILFQPHTFTRTAALHEDFVRELSRADEVALLDIYGARELPLPNVDSLTLARAISQENGSTHHFSDPKEAVSYLASTALPGDIIVTMGAGNVTELAPGILGELRERGEIDGG